jgi:hypothetical protein
MIEWGRTRLGLRRILPRDDRNIHDPATALLAGEWRPLGAMPESPVVYREVTRLDVKTDFPGIGTMIHEIFLPEQHPQHTLAMRTRNDAKSTMVKGAVIQVNAHVQHGHDALSQEKIARAVRMPAHLGETAVRKLYIIIEDESILFVFRNPALERVQQPGQRLEPGIAEQQFEMGGILVQEAHALDGPASLLILTELEGDPVDLGQALVHPLLVDTPDLIQEKAYLFRCDEIAEMNDAMFAEKGNGFRAQCSGEFKGWAFEFFHVHLDIQGDRLTSASLAVEVVGQN